MASHIPAGAILGILVGAVLIGLAIDYWENHIAPRQHPEDLLD